MASILFKLLFWLILSHFVHPYALLSPRAANLGIQFIHFDGKIGDTTFQYAFYGGVAEYDQDIDKLFPQDTWQYIAGLCSAALGEAETVLGKQLAQGQSHRLTGMNTFVVGKKVYFASPLAGWGKSAPPFIYEVMPKDEPLRLQLQKCQVESGTGKRHRISGNCGEMVNMQMWLKDNPGQQWDPNTPAYSIHIWKDGGIWRWQKPCGDDPPRGGEWGCKLWARNNGIRFLNNPNVGVKKTDIAPIHTRGVDTLWCSPEDGRTTAEQVGFQNPEESPDPASGADLDDFVDAIMEDQDDEYQF